MLNKQRKDLDSGVRDLTYRRKPNRMTAHFLSETMEPEGSGTVVFSAQRKELSVQKSTLSETFLQE